jgi:hypothetical protein
VPAAPGVGQFVAATGGSLLIGMPPNLRRWAAANLGLAKPARQGVRPRTNLRPVAALLRHAATRSGFEQRLCYERVMAESVALQARRELKRPAWLRLDPEERFPRLRVVGPEAPGPACFGPFRDRRAALGARDALNARYRLRPCDYEFEPDPELPLGRGCVYAQVRSCAAPCLERVSEAEYRGIARDAESALGLPSRRDEPELPRWIARADARALVLEPLEQAVQLFPIRAGRVLDAEIVIAPAAALDAALAGLRFEAAGARDDTPWLIAWLRERRRRGAYLAIDAELSRSGSALSNAIRSALAEAARGSPAAS